MDSLKSDTIRKIFGAEGSEEIREFIRRTEEQKTEEFRTWQRQWDAFVQDYLFGAAEIRSGENLLQDLRLLITDIPITCGGLHGRTTAYYAACTHQLRAMEHERIKPFSVEDVSNLENTVRIEFEKWCGDHGLDLQKYQDDLQILLTWFRVRGPENGLADVLTIQTKINEYMISRYPSRPEKIMPDGDLQIENLKSRWNRYLWDLTQWFVHPEFGYALIDEAKILLSQYESKSPMYLQVEQMISAWGDAQTAIGTGTFRPPETTFRLRNKIFDVYYEWWNRQPEYYFSGIAMRDILTSFDPMVEFDDEEIRRRTIEYLESHFPGGKFESRMATDEIDRLLSEQGLTPELKDALYSVMSYLSGGAWASTDLTRTNILRTIEIIKDRLRRGLSPGYR